ncbi:hypothetical protein DPMN_016964 [Dreissena polymorpha]|uniref:Uncharacterized protein n=1 Tax=Dreissena polymorpha TaxID=45954 RepID=A0A9D4S7N8_DREPO|nr:hypothetical protein DPMN_016964 [Dreissena polymorpha]
MGELLSAAQTLLEEDVCIVVIHFPQRLTGQGINDDDDDDDDDDDNDDDDDDDDDDATFEKSLLILCFLNV